MKKTENIIVKISCQDKPGLVVAITKILYNVQCNITDLKEHVEVQEDEPNLFFIRLECTGDVPCENIHKALVENLSGSADISVHREYKKDIVLLATKEYHCIGDILLRAAHNDLNANVKAIIANRENTKILSQAFSVPFHFVPVEETMTREDHEQAILSVLQQYSFEYIVLARYMRVLSEDFINTYPFKIINIHHSFLPAFIGANPYKQAHKRGVKIIGATAHFATKNLDEGPIITQQTIPVDHSYNTSQMRNVGRDVEKITLAKALELVLDDRVFVTGNKTIIL